MLIIGVSIVETAGVKAHKVSSVLITVLLMMGAYFQKSIEISWVLAYICMNLVLAIEMFRKEEQPFNNIVHTLMPVFWIAIPFAMAGVTNVFLGSKEFMIWWRFWMETMRRRLC